MQLFGRKSDATPDTPATAAAPESPVAPFQPGETVFVITVIPVTLIRPARVVDKVTQSDGWGSLYIVETQAGRMTVEPIHIVSVNVVKAAMNLLEIFPSAASAALDDPDKM
jgi:hypothetical protein